MQAIITLINFLKFQSYLGSSMPTRDLPSEVCVNDKPLPKGKDGMISAKELHSYFNEK